MPDGGELPGGSAAPEKPRTAPAKSWEADVLHELGARGAADPAASPGRANNNLPLPPGTAPGGTGGGFNSGNYSQHSQFPSPVDTGIEALAYENRELRRLLRDLVEYDIVKAMRKANKKKEAARIHIYILGFHINNSFSFLHWGVCFSRCGLHEGGVFVKSFVSI